MKSIKKKLLRAFRTNDAQFQTVLVLSLASFASALSIGVSIWHCLFGLFFWPIAAYVTNVLHPID